MPTDRYEHRDAEHRERQYGQNWKEKAMGSSVVAATPTYGERADFLPLAEDTDAAAPKLAVQLSEWGRAGAMLHNRVASRTPG